MEINELLDRFELLYPSDSFYTDLRKLVLNNDKFALFRIIQSQTDSQLIEGLRKHKDNENFSKDCFSRGQLQSKLWALQELEKIDEDLGTVFLCAGWYATLATLIFESNIKVDKIRSFDIDDSCRNIAEDFNKPWVLDDWKFKTATQDIHEINFEQHTYNVKRANGSSCELVDSPDTIINTSCEHIQDFDIWYNKIPKGKLVLLQGNNYYEIEDHINCCESLEEFSDNTPMSVILFEGEIELDNYTRFMKIGFK